MENEGVIGRETIANALNFILNKCRTTFATKAVATQSANGLMSASDKKKLDGLGGGKPTIKTNVSVPASAWKDGATADGSTRTKYAEFSFSGVTSSTYAQVVFKPDDCDNYNLAGVCYVLDGYIRIYAETAPSEAITIPTVVAWL